MRTRKAWRGGVAAGLLATLLAGCGSDAPRPQEAGRAAPTKQAEEAAPPEPISDARVPFTRVAGPQAGEAQELNGKGGRFPLPLYKRWFEAYSQKTNVHISYEGVGSDRGIFALSNRKVDFAASDAPMTDTQLGEAKGGPVQHILTAFGAIGVACNVPGLSAPLRLTPVSLAGIYAGEITRWDDPRLTRDNPSLANVHYALIVLHRADGSGTTYGFTDYLSAVNPAWARQAGRGTSVYWPVGFGATGSGGMARLLKRNPYSIGYIEAGYAQRSKLAQALMQNRAGQFVAPSVAGVTASASELGRSAPADLRFSIVNAPGAASYPLCTGTWLLAYRRSPDTARALALTRLLDWAVTDGQAVNASLGYAPIGSELSARSQTLIRQISAVGQSSPQK